jgi:hypothetical protein
MSANLALLLAFDRRVTFPQSWGTLRRIAGPVLPVREGDSEVAWFDPLDGQVQATSGIDISPVMSLITAVEWPAVQSDRPSGAAVCLGDPEAVAEWELGAWTFGVDRGLGCVVWSSKAEEVASRLRDMAEVVPVVSAVQESMVHPLTVDDQVIGIAFHCGMGASTNTVHRGVDAAGRTVALLADLEMLERAQPSADG